MIVMTIVEPSDTGHMPIIGYRVEYDGDMRDFELSMHINHVLTCHFNNYQIIVDMNLNLSSLI